jgi:tripartite-type tricarboxylate transporter receptor subunit TctC
MKRLGMVLLACALGHSAAGADEPLSFKGKTITLIVASSPGGGTDTSGRLIANFLASHLDGKPNVIVRNVPGAQGVTAMNYFVKQVVPDGLTLTMGAANQADPLLYRNTQALYDPRTFVMIGGLGRGGSVLLIRKDAEARIHDKSATPVIMGSLAGIPRSGMQTTLWGNNFLGWNAKWVIGYPGTNELMIALERGEIDMTSTSNLFQVKKLLDTGKFKIFAQAGALKNGQLVARPEFGDAPMMGNLLQGKITDPVQQQAYDYWMGLVLTDKWLALPPKSPDAYVQAYRNAFIAAVNDPEFAELGKKVSEEFEPMSSKDMEYLIGKLGATSPEAIAFIGTMLRKQGLEGEQ